MMKDPGLLDSEKRLQYEKYLNSIKHIFSERERNILYMRCILKLLFPEIGSRTESLQKRKYESISASRAQQIYVECLKREMQHRTSKKTNIQS